MFFHKKILINKPNGIAKIIPSTRSNIPPCPGIKFPVFLTLAFLLKYEINKSPNWQPIDIIIAIKKILISNKDLENARNEFIDFALSKKGLVTFNLRSSTFYAENRRSLRNVNPITYKGVIKHLNDEKVINIISNNREIIDNKPSLSENGDEALPLTNDNNSKKDRNYSNPDTNDDWSNGDNDW